MKTAYELKPFDVIRVNNTRYQVVMAVEPDMSMGGDNDTYLIYVLEQNNGEYGIAGTHTKFRCDPNDTFDIYAQANMGW